MILLFLLVDCVLLARMCAPLALILRRVHIVILVDTELLLIPQLQIVRIYFKYNYI